MTETKEVSPEETARLAEDKVLETLTERPNGLVPGTMAYQEHFRPGTTSLSTQKE